MDRIEKIKWMRLTSVWDRLEYYWHSVLHRLYDLESNTGPQEHLRLKWFRELALSEYSQKTVDEFLQCYGIVDRVINRGPHKKFLPDGSWISNGKRFGP